ncbi:MAG TPA: efflux RND transporter periplasmic adaptor subunit [Steroidobacteraceae bacterium]|jgi:cobalt-zinc-cadmium efflux system membrane fusion protein|nr:efflux RND transporter periplasmic adaptor subunit [Steroidobacteraceae bacterium]
MKNKLIFARALIVALAAAVSSAACSPKTDGSAQTASISVSNVKLTAAQRANIRLYTVASAPFRKTVEATGVVDFDNDQATSVLAPFSGPVSRLLVSLGEHVKRGQPLADVDSPDFAAAISAYRKAISTAQTARRLADLDRDLVEHSGVARREADQAETDAANAEADREAALQSLISLQVPAQAIKDIQEGRPISRLDGIIRAPISGTVVEKLITPGQLLEAGTTPCFTVADLSRVWVMAQVFGSDLESVRVGDQAQVITGIGSKDFSGAVDNIAALVDPDTRSVMVRVVVKNPGDLLKKQMYVRVSIQAHQENAALLIPVSSVLRDDVNLPFVYVVQSDGSFARQHVTLGYRSGDRYDIVEGLKVGDPIVVDGGIFVQFMQNQ